MKERHGIKYAAFVLILLVVLPLLAGCSGGNKGVNANLSSYKIELSQSTAKAGQVTFHVKNNATDMEHEFVIFKTDLAPGNLPLDGDGNVAEDQLQSVDEVELQANEAKDLTVNLDPGHYVIVCNMPGHYKQGMYTEFTVQ